MVAARRQLVWTWVARGAIALVLGLATTLGVAAWAWGWANIRGSTARVSGSDAHARCEVTVWRGTFRTSANAIWWADGAAADASTELRDRAVAILPHSAWRSACLEEFNGSNPAILFSLQSFGWPMRCLSGWQIRSSPMVNSVRSTGLWKPARFGMSDPFPVYPFWGGFLVNMLVYGAVWWVLLMTPGRVRQLARAYAGLCTECGYDLRGLPTATCPECGARSGAGEGALIGDAVPGDRPG